MKIVDLSSHQVIDTISTGGSHWVDGLAYDAHDHIVGAANNADQRPCLTRKLLRTFPVTKCLPAGLAIGPSQKLLVGCGDDAVAAGFPAKSMILDLPSGKIVHTDRSVANVPTGPHAHSVAADGATGQVFVPITASKGDARCDAGCIAVFSYQHGSRETHR